MRLYHSTTNFTERIANLGEVGLCLQEYLKFTGKDSGNRLEHDVFAKLHDSDELAHLKAIASCTIIYIGILTCSPNLIILGYQLCQ